MLRRSSTCRLGPFPSLSPIGRFRFGLRFQISHVVLRASRCRAALNFVRIPLHAHQARASDYRFWLAGDGLLVERQVPIWNLQVAPVHFSALPTCDTDARTIATMPVRIGSASRFQAVTTNVRSAGSESVPESVPPGCDIDELFEEFGVSSSLAGSSYGNDAERHAWRLGSRQISVT
jgi:hypothetical protein